MGSAWWLGVVRKGVGVRVIHGPGVIGIVLHQMCTVNTLLSQLVGREVNGTQQLTVSDHGSYRWARGGGGVGQQKVTFVEFFNSC